MRIKVKTLEGAPEKEIELPKQFEEEPRPDLVKKAVQVLQANKRQKYGASPEAGKRHSAELSRRRRKYRGSYGYGISRVPRKIMSRRGTRMNWEGAFAPGTRGGRRAHPPKAEKNWEQKINKKENRKAIRSAISASVITEIVEKRGHKVPKDYPFVISSKIEDAEKTKEVKKVLEKLGLKEELERVSKTVRKEGKAKIRGRKTKVKIGPLIVVSKECKLSKAAKNVKGVDVVPVNAINAEVLAPGAVMGRLTLWSESAIEKMGKEKLYL
ncbi:50S ribosomal protein L4 [Candidatus Woesearchaeota archaeon]|nr:MAG: 50S ribosomal protein L4 [Candidatus Woesearchaeota archaeon]